MMHSTPTAPTLKDAIAHMEAHGTASQQQDIRKAKGVFALHGIEAAGLNTFPADLVTFERQVPKLTGTMPGLQKLIYVAGISDNTYKQNWRAGRRLISDFIGATAEKKERKTRDDAWAEMHRMVKTLVKVGLVKSHVLKSLPSLIDDCRMLNLAPADLNTEMVTALLNADGVHTRKTLRKGLKALDELREIPRLTDLLPAAPVTPAPKPAGRLVTLSPYFQEAIRTWVARYAREQVEDARFSAHAEPLSKPARDRYSAALSLWVETLIKLGATLRDGTRFDDLFTTERIDSVLGQWNASKPHAASTIYHYTGALISVMARHGLADEASFTHGLTKLLPRLKEGRAAGKRMGADAKKWCAALIRDPQKTALFDRQHYEYFRLAQEVLTTAKTEEIDLRKLSDPGRMAALSDAKRSRAKHLLRRVRMFGVLAAYAAIALEGAPYRRQNILGARHTGPKKTIFLHLSGAKPHAIVKFPNEELKNGKWLTERGEELEPVTIEKRYEEDYGPEILKWYLKEIRPLFPEADKTHCLFPPIEHAPTTETGFLKGTFDIWLAEGSAEIGLPLSSHNFRHGYCSISFNEGRVSMEDLAKIMGDTVATLRRHYAWINAAASVVAVQKDTARRRAERAKARKRNTQ
jgi:hypothetical protein